MEALRQLAEFTFENHAAERDFIRLVMIENLHDGAYMSDNEEMSGENVPAILLLEAIWPRGCAEGLFRTGLSALELHWQISTLSCFNVSNRATFSKIFGGELFGPEGQARLMRQRGIRVVRFALKGDQFAAFETRRRAQGKRRGRKPVARRLPAPPSERITSIRGCKTFFMANRILAMLLDLPRFRHIPDRNRKYCVGCDVNREGVATKTAAIFPPHSLH